MVRERARVRSPTRVGWSSRTVTSVATLWAGLAGAPLVVSARPSVLGSPVVAFLVHGALPLAVLAAVLAWLTNSLRYCPVMIGCGVLGTTLSALHWHADVGVYVATLGVAVSSFMSTNQSSALRAAWEQAAPAAAAASGWFSAWAILLLLPAVFVPEYRVVLLLVAAGAVGFARYALVTMDRVKAAFAAGAEPSPYMIGKPSLTLLLRFLVGAGYALLSVPLVAVGIYSFVHGQP